MTMVTKVYIDNSRLICYSDKNEMQQKFNGFVRYIYNNKINKIANICSINIVGNR